MSGPTEDELRAEIERLLKDANLNEMTVKKIRKSLEVHFSTDLSSMKSQIKEIVSQIMDELDRRPVFKLSPELSKMLGEDIFKDMTDVSAAILEYAKKNNLIDRDDDKLIRCNEGLKKLANCEVGYSDKIATILMDAHHIVKENLNQLDEYADDNSDVISDDGKSNKQKIKAGGSKKRRASTKQTDSGKKRKPNWKAMQLSEDLAFICGANQLERTQVVKKLWEYIKEKNLQNPDNKREILCDEAFKKVMGRDK